MTGAGAARPYDAAGERRRREPIKGVRKMMGQAMVDSAFTAPHVTEWVTVDVTRTMEFVDRLKARREFRDVKVSPLLVLARAVHARDAAYARDQLLLGRARPRRSSSRATSTSASRPPPRAAWSCPTSRTPSDLSLLDLAGALNQLTATAREGKTQPADMSGGTFTITNVGVFGVDSGTPIINPGESAILGFGAVQEDAVGGQRPTGDEIVVRQVTTLALSFDHRHVDGEKGSRFLADVAAIMEDPAAALLFCGSRSAATAQPVTRRNPRVPGRQYLGLALAGHAGTRGIGVLPQPGEGVARSLGDGPHGEAGGAGGVEVVGHHPVVLRPRQPQRQRPLAHPGLDLVLGEELLARPHDVGGRADTLGGPRPGPRRPAAPARRRRRRRSARTRRCARSTRRCRGRR